MSEYILKWKEKYRCKAMHDISSGEFPREKNKELITNDIFIECNSGDFIIDYSSSKSILLGFFSSKQRGCRVLFDLYSELYDDADQFVTTEGDTTRTDWDGFIECFNSKNNPMCYDIDQTDIELELKFNGNKYIDRIAPLMKAKKPMATTSPFNVRYLPAHKEKLALKRAEDARMVKYKDMPKDYWTVMSKEIVPSMARKHELKIGDAIAKCYTLFSKKKKIKFVQEADKNNYKVNHYIHKLGLWDEFVEYLQDYVKS